MGKFMRKFCFKKPIIIEGWNKDNLTSGQTEIIEELKNIEENPYPFEEVE